MGENVPQRAALPLSYTGMYTQRTDFIDNMIFLLARPE